jgi:hypothetical protein
MPDLDGVRGSRIWLPQGYSPAPCGSPRLHERAGVRRAHEWDGVHVAAGALGLAHLVAQVRRRQVAVSHRHRQGGVTKDLLQRGELPVSHDIVRRERMTEIVKREIVDLRLAQCRLERLPRGGLGEHATAPRSGNPSATPLKHCPTLAVRWPVPGR